MTKVMLRRGNPSFFYAQFDDHSEMFLMVKSSILVIKDLVGVVKGEISNEKLV